MVYLIWFSLAIAWYTATHHIGGVIVLMFLIGIIGMIRHRSIRECVGYIIMIVLALISVTIYDRNRVDSWHDLSQTYQGLFIPSPLPSSSYFLVNQKESLSTYSLTRQGTHDHFLLVSSQELVPGSLIQSFHQPQWIGYHPELCFLICRQNGQLIDIDAGILTNIWSTESSFDYGRWLYMKGYAGVIYDSQVSFIDHTELPRYRSFRSGFLQHIREQFGTGIHAALLGGMTIGDTSLFEKEWYQQFISSGLVHIVAVSGGNIALIIIVLQFIFVWVPFYLRQLLFAGAIVGYVSMVGFDSSMIRAAIMALLTILALLPGRTLSLKRSMAYAWIMMLIYNPYYLLYDVGFIMSFSALVGIMMATTYYTDHWSIHHLSSVWTRRWHYIVQSYLAPTFGAFVGVLPWVLSMSGQLNLTSLLGNILIIPLIPIVMIGGIVSAYIPLLLLGKGFILTVLYVLEWISMITTQYGVYVSFSRWSYMLMIRGVIGVMIWWLRKSEE